MKNFTVAVVAVGILFLLLYRSGCIQQGPGARTPDTTVVRDTVWHESQKTIIKEVAIAGSDDSYIPTEPEYQPSADLDSLIVKFNALVKELTTRNFYRDSLKLDSIGYVVVKDTVQFNKLQKRSYEYYYRIPQVNTTTTINNYAVPVRQLYVGGGVMGNKTQGLQSYNAGLLYKNKRDQMFGLNIGSTINGGFYYGVQTYWKLGTKKK